MDLYRYIRQEVARAQSAFAECGHLVLEGIKLIAMGHRCSVSALEPRPDSRDNGQAGMEICTYQCSLFRDCQ